VIETDVKEFKIEVESELRKDKHFRDVIERLKEELIKKSKNNTLLRLPDPHSLVTAFTKKKT